MIVTEGDGKEFVIAGTVLEHRHPRIVQIGDFPITFVPEGRLLTLLTERPRRHREGGHHSWASST